MIGAAANADAETQAGLVHLAARGDERAFATIVRRHHDDMFRVAFVVVGDRDVADEAVASAWPIVWRKLSTLREPDRLRAWLCSVAANQARQIVRTNRRRTLREIAISDPIGSAIQPDPGARTADIDLADALRKLDPDDRTLLALRYVSGLNSTELARALGISASGVRGRLARLLERMRKELGDE